MDDTMHKSLATRLAAAQKIFDDGSVRRAARLLREERRAAGARNADDELAEIDAVIASMRGRLVGRELEEFDSNVTGKRRGAQTSTVRRPGRDSGAEIDSTPLGFWLSIVGAAGMVLAVFLPEASSSTPGPIVHNTSIQNGDGWLFIALAVGELGAIYAAYKGRRRTWGPLIAGAIGLGFAIYEGTSGSALRLCSIADPSSCERASPGIGLYLAGLGGGLMILGGWRLRSASPAPSVGGPAATDAPQAVPAATREMKRCPDCAEDVLAEARVCKHCGFRFEAIQGA